MDNKPIKLFPCDCMAEGLVVVVEEDGYNNCEESPFIDIAFFEHTGKLEAGSRLSYWCRIKYAFRILRGKSPWDDMVILNRNVAKSFANHILYLIKKYDKENKKV